MTTNLPERDEVCLCEKPYGERTVFSRNNHQPDCPFYEDLSRLESDYQPSNEPAYVF